MTGLRLGLNVQVSSLEDKNIKYMTKFVGTDCDAIFITVAPNRRQLNHEKPVYDDIFYNGHPLVMRLIIAGAVYAFETSVVSVYFKKGRLLMCTFPEKLQTRQLRKENRYSCTLLCTLEGIDIPWSGIIDNISVSGCQLRVTDKRSLQSLEKLKRENGNLAMNILFPFDEGRHIIQGKIKSLALGEKNSIAAGISFAGGKALVRRYFEYCSSKMKVNIFI